MTIEQFINSNIHSDIQAREILNKQIGYLEQGKYIYAVGQDPVKATADWLEKLKKFRFELDTIITELLLHKSRS
jgi:hypothetical protein